MKQIIKILLCFSIILFLFGCKQETEIDKTPEEQLNPEDAAVDEFESIQISELQNRYQPNGIWNNSFAINSYEDFAIRQLAYSYTENENEIISPLSLYYALAILTNGASGDTRQELETVLGMTTDDLNSFLYDFDKEFDNVEEWTKYYNKANAILFNTGTGLSLKDDYKNTISKHYGDSFYEGDFNNAAKITTDVNSWASKNTDGAIDNVVNDGEITKETAMLILNALTSGDTWSQQFESSETFYEEFNSRDNSKGLVEMMHQTLYGYINDGRSEGFVKYLTNNAVFIGIIPNLAVDIYDYLNLMDFSTLSKYKSNILVTEKVGETESTNYEGQPIMCDLIDVHYTNLSFPKFSFEKEYDLNKTLKKFGLKNIFDYTTSDFSSMADGPQELVDELFVSKVKQKCSIEVNEEEVKAAAVTSVFLGLGGGDGGCSELRNNVYHDVIFDRPFIFALMTPDYSREAIPMFIGIVTKLGEPIETAIQIENITGKINIRSIPSTQGEKLGSFEKGKIIYAFETKEAEGYTWYRIGTDKWVADKNGEWIQVLS